MSRPARLVLLAVCALLVAAAPAAAKSNGKLKLIRGATTLTLDEGALDALTSLGVAPAPPGKDADPQESPWGFQVVEDAAWR